MVTNGYSRTTFVVCTSIPYCTIVPRRIASTVLYSTAILSPLRKASRTLPLDKSTPSLRQQYLTDSAFECCPLHFPC